jgi:hypothetical protein
MLRVAGELAELDGLVSLNPEVGSARELRNRALAFLLDLLRYRLEERAITDPIRPLAFAAALDAGPLTEQLAEEVAPNIAWLYRSESLAARSIEPGAEGPAADALAEAPFAAEPLCEPELYSLDDASEQPGEVGVPAIERAAEESGAESPPPVPKQGDSFSEIDMDALTREAVAAGHEDPPVLTPLPPVEPGALDLPAEPEELPRPPARAPDTQTLPPAVPVADWVSDPKMPLPRFGPPDRPGPQHRTDPATGFDKIAPPPPTSAKPPPLPPESA